ncbi:hypothetical protein Tco_0070965 [Tanacetum coccineum]
MDECINEVYGKMEQPTLSKTRRGIPVIPEVPIEPDDPLVAPEVGAVSVISPTGVLDLVDYSSSSFDSDPSEDSLPLALELPLVSPFLYSANSKADILRWRDRVTSRPSSPPRSSPHDTLAPSSEFPLAPVVAPPGIRRRPAILVQPSEAIPFGQPYNTHPNRPHKLLTARKRLGPFPTHRLAWRRVSHHSSDRHSSPDFTSDSSSSGSSSDSSSDTSSGSPSYSLSDSSPVYLSGCDTSGQIHSGPSTRVASPRSAPLSTPYPSTTSESSPYSSLEKSLDSSSPSVGPSRKRCRSPTTLVPLSTLVLRSIAPTLSDLLPPHKRFRDLYSPKASGEEHMEIGTVDAEAVIYLGIGDGVGAPTKDGTDPLVTSGFSESTGGDAHDLEGTLYDIAHYMLEVPLNRITKFETAQRHLEAGQLVASGERVGLADRVRRLGWENLRVRALLCIERDRVDSLRHYMELSHEEFRQIRRDHDDTRRRLRRTMTNTRSRMTATAIEEMINRCVAEALDAHEANRNIRLGNGNDEGGNGNGDGNGNRGGNENRNHNENDRGARPVVHECTYQDFMKCQSLNFKGTEGVVGLISALTWWNSHKRTIGTDVAFAMSWRELMKLMA